VLDANNNVVGIIRLTHQLSSVVWQFQRVRIMITGVLAGGLLLGGLLGWFLALGLEQPIKRVTEAVTSLARGEPQNLPAVQSPVEIRELTEAVNKLVDRLDTLEQSRRRLLANLVHEIGRPLGALQSGLQALVGGADSDPQLRQELLVGMQGEVRILERTLDELSQIYDQILGSLELDRQPVDMVEWLQQTLPPWREAALSKRLTWEANIPANLPSLEIDPDRLSQALGNLISNAIKYTPQGGKITIEAGTGKMNPTNEPDGQRQPAFWIRVSDTGPGIPEEEQEKIFAPFYRGSKQGRFPSGMGLGLTIASDLTHAHSGKLTVESEPANGSSFTIWLPLPE
jgi:signal transduction histidine kinase